MAVNHHAEHTTDLTGRDQAYRMVAELLVGFRRIVARGMVRLFGEGWLDDGCPAVVRERVLARRAADEGLDRFAAEVEDPFTYATFADLADIVESVDALASLLRKIAGSPELLVENLRELEELRSKIAAMRRVSERELSDLADMHLRLREKLTGARRRATRDDDGPERGDSPAAETTSREPTVGKARSPGDVTVRSERRVRPDDVEGSSQARHPFRLGDDDGPGASPSPTVDHAPSTRLETGPPSGGRVGGSAPARAAVPLRSAGRDDAAALDGAPTPVGLVRVDEEDLSVLRALRREIIAAAEAAYASGDAIPTDAWRDAWESGWYSRSVDHYGLGEVATFYAVMEEYLERRRAGAGGAALKTFLADRELAKVLLRLRELFLRLRV